MDVVVTQEKRDGDEIGPGILWYIGVPLTTYAATNV